MLNSLALIIFACFYIYKYHFVALYDWAMEVVANTYIGVMIVGLAVGLI